MFFINQEVAKKSDSKTGSVFSNNATQTKHTTNVEHSDYVFNIDAADMLSLRVLFLRHMKQQRWIYFLNDKMSIKTNAYPVLQVKLSESHSQFDSIVKLIQYGQTGAILVERSKMTPTQLRAIRSLCNKNRVMLILLNQQQKAAFH